MKRKHSKQGNRAFVLAVAAAVALTAGACAKVGDQQAAAGNSSVGITDDSIKLGTAMGLAGKTGGGATAAMQGAQSYFNRVNDEGGVNGRKIEFEALDDGFNASQTAANVRKLVEQDKVFALFYLGGVNQTLGALPYIEANNVVLFGPQAPVRRLVDPVKKSVFLISPTFYEQGQVDARYLVTAGAKKLGVLYENDPIGQEAVSGGEAEGPRQGAT